MTEQNTALDTTPAAGETGGETNTAEETKTNEPGTRGGEETNIPETREEGSKNTGMDNKDHIIARQADKIAKMESAQNDTAKASTGGEDIMKAVEEKYGKALDSVGDMKTDIDVKNFLAKEENAMFREFAGDITRFAKHPSRANLPIQSIAYEVAGPSLLKKGADMAREGDATANESQTGGGSKAQPIVGKKVADMSSEDMEKSLQDLRFGNK